MVRKKRQTDALDDGSSTDSSDERTQQSPTAAAANGGCQHSKKAVDPQRLRKLLKITGLAIDCDRCVKPATVASAEAEVNDDIDSLEFEYDNTLWLCLKCGTQLCGRSKNKHALEHFKTPHSDSHALTMNTRSYEIWCYECNNEVNANSRKNLLECVEVVKKMSQKPTPITNLPSNTISNLQQGFQQVGLANQIVGPLIPSAPPPPPPIPGMAKRVNKTGTPVSALSMFNPTMNGFKNMQSVRSDLKVPELPRVRGLSNLGNTCFFNAVMQCLAQTPFLLEVLRESAEPGEKFILPGGTFQFKDSEVDLPMIEGTLATWGSLTATLANTLEELQSGGGVFSPTKLFDKLCTKCPQFRGGDQHDSHELLRHLLESVRSEDLKRYQRVILQNLGYKDQDINSVSEELRQKCKIYGNQAADRILRPEQVFRGFLVSTLTCQDCYNTSSRHENFLDMSLPVSVEKPAPPQRFKSSPENSPTSSATSFYLNPAPAVPTKLQIKKEKEKERKSKSMKKKDPAKTTINKSKDGNETSSSVSTDVTESDADIEDNTIDENQPLPPLIYDANGNDTLTSPNKPEKSDENPENMDKDSLDEDENDSGIATSPANGSFPSNDTNASNSIVSVGLSEKGVSLVKQLSQQSNDIICEGNEVKSNDLSNGQPAIQSSVTCSILMKGVKNNVDKEALALTSKLKDFKLQEAQKENRKKAARVRTQSYSDWSTTIAPRYQCEEGECSIQSCLNNFTAVELMTGTNKVGCDDCTKRINGEGEKAKTIYTNATKQFLVSSPPAVLILHLKRFQLGPRCMFRKLTRAVSFTTMLDIAPFCGSKVKNLPNIDRSQKKLLYALYGVVEHSGSMYGGHYTAYVKVRPKLTLDDKRWKFIPQGSKAELEQDDEQRKKLEELLAKEKARELRMKAAGDSDDDSHNSSDTSSETEETAKPNEENFDDAANIEMPYGKWYYVSDSSVQEVKEEEVLRAQAYLLFYERIY